MSDEEKDISRFESVPSGLKLSGPGLKEMSLQRFNTLMRTFSGMGIEVEAIDEASAEESGEDTPLYREDFQAYAKEHGLSRNLATLAWNSLLRGRQYLSGEITMDEGYDEEKGRAMSRHALRRELGENALVNLPCIGEGGESLIRGVVGSTEPPQQ